MPSQLLFSQTDFNNMQSDLLAAKTDSAAGNLTAAENDISQFYQYQYGYDGYSQLADEVVTNTGFGGNVANNMLALAGVQYGSSTSVSIMLNLANLDLDDIGADKVTGGYDPASIAQLDANHYTVYQTDFNLGIQYWGGTVFAATGGSFIPDPSPAELLNIRDPDFIGLPNGTVELNILNLNGSIGAAVASTTISSLPTETESISNVVEAERLALAEGPYLPAVALTRLETLGGDVVSILSGISKSITGAGANVASKTVNLANTVISALSAETLSLLGQGSANGISTTNNADGSTTLSYSSGGTTTRITLTGAGDILDTQLSNGIGNITNNIFNASTGTVTSSGNFIIGGAGSYEWTLTGLNGASTSVSLSGISSISGGAGSAINFITTSGVTYSLTPVAGATNGNYSLTGSNGTQAILNPTEVQAFSFGATLTINTDLGDTIVVPSTNGSGTLEFNGITEAVNPGYNVSITNNSVDVGANGSALGTDYAVTGTGALASSTSAYTGFSAGSTFAQTGSSASSLLANVNLDYNVGTQSAAITPGISDISDISVVNLGSVPLGPNSALTDPAGNIAGGLLISTGDANVVDPTVNLNGLDNNSPAGIIDGYDRPGNQQLSTPSNNLYDLVNGSVSSNDGQSTVNLSTYDGPYSDYSAGAPSFVNIDPLVLDLTGQGVQLSNWISNSVYFQTNVVYNSATETYATDNEEHHTSWTLPGTGILVLPNAQGTVTNITQTVSEFFQGKSYADSLAALASLATPGAKVFSAATSLVDPTTETTPGNTATGKTYFSELSVWNDANQNGVVDAGELTPLSTLLGTTGSISLVGTGNQGEAINGSAVTNLTSYTNASGAVDQAASVDFQTDTTGDVTTTADGGVIINSTPEGGPTAASSFVDKNTTGQTYTISNGTLVDKTTGVTVGSGFDAVFTTGQGGKPFEQLLDTVKNQPRDRLMPRTFILLADSEPIGTASLVAHDLDQRPEFTPWLAGMFVVPQSRGQGYAARLTAAVEQKARAAAISTLWLYTNTAERIYARAGWQTFETIQLDGRLFSIMNRNLINQR